MTTPAPPNPSFLGPMQVALDSTSLGAFKKCPRYYELNIVRGLVGSSGRGHLEFGQLLHRGREVYHKARWAGADHEEALDSGLRELFVAAIQEDGSLWTSPIPEKRIDTLVQAYVWLCDQFAGEDLTTMTIDGKPAVELSFTLPTHYTTRQGHPIVLCGHIDRIAQDPWGRVVGLDLKTSSESPSSWYMRQFAPSNQITGMYSWAIERLVGRPLSAFLIEVVQVQVNSCTPTRLNVPVFPENAAQWYEELGWWIESMEGCAERGHYPMNDTQCQRCTFNEVCSAGRSNRETMLKSCEVRMWNPLEVRT